jgi:Fis family transcriptional regulator
MKYLKSPLGLPRGGMTPEQVLVISSSGLLATRLAVSFRQAGYPVSTVNHLKDFLRSRRQRPFLCCFLDTRTQDESDILSACLKERPAERYILIRASRGRRLREGNGTKPGSVFGYLREHFEPEEAVAWCSRAAAEARLQQGDQSLDDLLYDRFRTFLQNLGPSPMTRLHDLVWERVERPLITSVLEWTGGNQTKAADILGMHRNTLRAKIRALGIDAAL